MTKAANGINVNTIVMSVCTFIILSVLGWVGHTASSTHDSSIGQSVEISTMKADIAEIKTKMLTRADLSIELLKLQVPIVKLQKDR